NINNGGLLDATAATSTFKTGTQLGQYFVVAGTGTLKRNVASTATLFPIGTSSTSYSPVTLTNTGTADNFSVTLKNTFTNTPPTPTQVVNKQWTITEQGTGAIATASFGWATADHASAFNPANSVAVMNYVGSAWVNYALSGALTGTGTVTDPYIAACAKNFTTFGNFGVTNGTGLPVSFASISAVKSVIGTDVSWSIATEVNTDKYVVEKSTDSRSFSAIGAVTATNAGKYSFADLSVNNGTSFYRIKAIDKDGTFQYSTVVSINSTNATASVQVYPNPVNNGNLNVQLSNLNKGNYSISVYNTIGQIIYTKNIVCNNLNTVLSIALPTSVKAGTYNLKITDGTTSITKTISVQ
ncbi:MAG: T9SS type A sorting domain-containing protein, partial [Pedobacter sp.]|nr:T9SS type A sorting domain-containing protein [Chitinophagaceae bacterium]